MEPMKQKAFYPTDSGGKVTVGEVAALIEALIKIKPEQVEGLAEMVAPMVHQHHWEDIVGVPEDVLEVSPEWSQIDNKPDKFEPVAHAHSLADLVDMPQEFPPQAHTHSIADMDDMPAVFPPERHSHPKEDISNWPATFPPEQHFHKFGDLLELPETFTPSAHGHLWQDIRNVPNFALQNHTHSMNDVSSLGSAWKDQLLILNSMAEIQSALQIPTSTSTITHYTREGKVNNVKVFTELVTAVDGNWSVDYSFMQFSAILSVSYMGIATGTDLGNRRFACIAKRDSYLQNMSGYLLSSSSAGLLAAMTMVAASGSFFLRIEGV